LGERCPDHIFAPFTFSLRFQAACLPVAMSILSFLPCQVSLVSRACRLAHHCLTTPNLALLPRSFTRFV
jgi:hypothetical protein